MIASPLRSHVNTTVHFRPLRVAFFIRESDEPAFIRATTIATTQWGGIYCPVVPVAVDQEPPLHAYFEEVLRLFEPDIFVELAEADEGFRRNLTGRLAALFPRRKINLANGRGFERNDQSLHAIGAVPEHVRLREDLKLPERANLPLAARSAVFGRIETDALNYYSKNFGGLKTVAVGEHDGWEAQHTSAWNASPVNLTNYGLHPLLVTDAMEAPWFDLVVGESVQALCLYWTMRAVREITQFSPSGRRVLFCTPNDIGSRDGQTALLTFLRRHLAVEGITANVDLLVHCWTDSEYEVAKAALAHLAPDLEACTAEQITCGHHSGQNIPRDFPGQRNLVYAFNAPQLPGSFRAGAGTAIPRPTTWQTGADNFVALEPIQGVAAHWGNVAQDVECDVLRRVPHSPSVAVLIKPEAWFSRWGLTRIAGLPSRDGYESLSLPTEWSALSAWFADRGLGMRMGAAGKYGEAAIAVLGGLDRVHDIATRQAYALLQKLSLKSSKKVAQRLVRLSRDIGHLDEEAIATLLADLNIGPELKGIPKHLQQLQSDPDLEPKRELPLTVASMVERRVLVRGLFVTCRNCGNSDWHGLAGLDETTCCPGCGHVQTLALLDSGGNEMRWQFRLNSLFNRAVDQDVIPNILALYRLRGRHGGTCCAVGLELLRADGEVQHELDALYVSEGQVIGAECKVGPSLRAKDLAAARTAAQCGFSEFWFATIAEQWSDSTQADIEELRRGCAAHPTAFGMLTAEHLFGDVAVPRPLRNEA